MGKIDKLGGGKKSRKERGTLAWRDDDLPAVVRTPAPANSEVSTPTVLARISIQKALPDTPLNREIEKMLAEGDVEKVMPIIIDNDINLPPELQIRLAQLCLEEFLSIVKNDPKAIPEPRSEKELNLWLKRTIDYYLKAHYPQGIWEAAFKVFEEGKRLVESNFLAGIYLLENQPPAKNQR